MTSFDDLLELQELDTRIDQLQHRRRSLPELEVRAQLRNERDGVTAGVDELSERLRAVRSVQKEAEDHAALLREKAEEVDRSLYDGSVVAHKELESLQEELALLRARIDEHEDRELEAMEEAEPLESDLAERREQLAAVEERLAESERAVAEARAGIDAELERLGAARDATAARVSAELLAAYEPLRESLGVAVARLSGARCEGCHLEIPSAQLEEVRQQPDDAVVRCPECLRILVR